MEKDTEKNNTETEALLETAEILPEPTEPANVEPAPEPTAEPVVAAEVLADTVSDLAPAAPAATTPLAAGARPDKRNPREFKKNVRKGPRRESKVKPEFDQKIISIRRVTRVVTGGRRFSFSVAVVAGNRKGSVGVGLGKAGDTSLAIEKALRSAKKNMINVSLTKSQSIPHEVSAKFSASRVMIIPAPGRGIIAGSSVRTVLELAGIKDVGAKIRSGSKNKINNARVAIEALKMLPKTKVTIPAPLMLAVETDVAGGMIGGMASGATEKESAKTKVSK